MTALAEKIYDEALDLPTDSRLELIDRLLGSVNLPVRQDIQQAWLEEAHLRRNRMLSGEDKPIPGGEVFAEIRKRFE
ncbi:MAG: addiction module protein [Kiritimatiellales bacterium]|nr:addiction module protein [Kiritimatiellales bacterium]MCF7864170.1 addiction module protein [Kiritimatiellales bacterium]